MRSDARIAKSSEHCNGGVPASSQNHFTKRFLVVKVGEFVAESHYVYEHGEFLLRAYEVSVLTFEVSLSVHDAVEWVAPENLTSFIFAPADIPIAQVLMTKG